MVNHIFLSKIERFDWVTERDIAFMHHLIEGHSISLPFLMLSQINEAGRKQQACLPYGMIFTLVFEKFGVDCTSEDAKKLLHTDRYKERSLHQMGYQKVDGHQIKCVSGQRSARSDSFDKEFATTSDDDEEKDDDDKDDDEDEAPNAARPSIGEISGQPTSSRTPPIASTLTVPTSTRLSIPPLTTTRITLEQFTQLSETQIERVSSMIRDLQQEFIQSHQSISRSYQELRKDMRELSHQMNVVEQG